MSDENNYSFWATMFGAMLGWIGINARWTHGLAKKIDKCPKVYVPKEVFNHRIDRMEDALRTDIRDLRQEIKELADRRFKPRG